MNSDEEGGDYIDVNNFKVQYEPTLDDDNVYA